MGILKTITELPEAIFKQAEATAIERGQTLNEFVAEALRCHLTSTDDRSIRGEHRIMESFGVLRDLHDETMRIQSLIDEEFGQIEE